MEDDALREYAAIVVGMVAADASEVHVAAYLGHLEDQLGLERSAARHRRLEAIAVWHVAKAALTRDRALRLLADGEAPDATAEHERLSDWLAGQVRRAGKEP